ncbi:hypothetical protein BDW72DRAFT_67984 [Aspergillus terricola var. indicus]
MDRYQATGLIVPGLINARSSIILVQTIKKVAQTNAGKRVLPKEKKKVMERLDRTRTEEGGASDEVRCKEHKGQERQMLSRAVEPCVKKQGGKKKKEKFRTEDDN